MTIEQIAIVALLAMQAVTFFLLWRTQQMAEWFRNAWVRDTKELLHWKRNAVMRDPKSGKYVKRDQS
jgi:hypothetical protein